MRDAKYDILFEPLAIGPHVAKNRFYQVPHCNGGGYRDPSAAAAMRGIKSEGGWGVIFTEQTEMHHTSEITPFIELRLWEDKDIPGLRRMSDAMKVHGALAGSQHAAYHIGKPRVGQKEIDKARPCNFAARKACPRKVHRGSNAGGNGARGSTKGFCRGHCKIAGNVAVFIVGGNFHHKAWQCFVGESRYGSSG